MTNVDLNADLGEGGPWDAELLQIVSSCNVACGGHAGSARSMEETIRMAASKQVAVGAHPAYPDREGFGRVSGFMSGDRLYESLTRQVIGFVDCAAHLGVKVTHIKAHGALYNDAVADTDLAVIIARVTAETPGTPAMIGMANTELQRAAVSHGLAFVAEAFVDRAYLADGTLVPRSEPAAVHSEINVITSQAVSLARDGLVMATNGELIEALADTLCIHGDTPGAASVARAVRDVLENRGVEIRAVR